MVLQLQWNMYLNNLLLYLLRYTMYDLHHQTQVFTSSLGKSVLTELRIYTFNNHRLYTFCQLHCSTANTNNRERHLIWKILRRRIIHQFVPCMFFKRSRHNICAIHHWVDYKSNKVPVCSFIFAFSLSQSIFFEFMFCGNINGYFRTQNK